MLRLGVEGKATGWRTLRAQADTDARLDAEQLDDRSLDNLRWAIDKIAPLLV